MSKKVVSFTYLSANTASRHIGRGKISRKPVLLCLILTMPILLAACGSDPANTPVSGTGGNAISTGPGAGTQSSGAAGGLPSAAGKAGAGGKAIGAGGQSIAGTTKVGNGGKGGKSGASVAGKGAGGKGGSGGSGTQPVAGSGAVGLTDKQTLIPHASWTCGMPEGIPPAKSGQLVFEANMTVGEVYDLGETQYGHRVQIDITGGKVTGSKLNGELWAGGLDYQLTLANGVLEIEQINVIRASDGTLIYFRNCGTSPAKGGEVRMVPDIEAPTTSAHDWLNTAKIVGIRQFDMAKKTLRVSFYDVSDVAAGNDKVTVTNPDGVPDQTWECKKKTTEIQGAQVYIENVGIGALTTLGVTKRGTRNAVPITGGTTSGDVAGTILSGGGDYQLSNADGFEIDARYTLKSNEGDLIIVRNCGIYTTPSSLIPVFETRKDSKYAWINEGNYLSSNPTPTGASVILTIYKGN